VTTLVSVGITRFEVFTAVLMKICSVLACDTWSLGKQFLTFRRIVVPFFQGQTFQEGSLGSNKVIPEKRVSSEASSRLASQEIPRHV
jgi:hypothetical protein